MYVFVLCILTIQYTFRRVEHLVYAEYITSGSISNRMISIAYLLMRLFPNASPVAEKILRFYHKIGMEILPSEQLHRDYSIASVAIQSFDVLFDQDKELYDHLQFTVCNTNSIGDTAQYYHSLDDSSGSISLANDKKSLLRLSQARANNSFESKESSSNGPVPSVYLLSSWLENGYMGEWLNIWTSTYIWDVLLCLGWESDNGMLMHPSANKSNIAPGTSAVFATFLPHLNCILLMVSNYSFIFKCYSLYMIHI